MPSVRRSARPSANCFVAVAFALVAVIFAAAVVCVEPPASSACPIAMPNSLRARFTNSDIVAVARVGDSVAVWKQSEAMLASTELHLTSRLKGEGKEKVVNLQHLVWSSGEAQTDKYKKDDVVLVFLRRVEKGDAYISADGERGIQKLPEADLKVYVRRIEELATIMRSEKPDEAALGEWLVRCAEEPATRWEGAYDLAFNAARFEDPPDEEEVAGEEEEEPDTESSEVEAAAPETAEDGSGQSVGNSSAEPAGVAEGANAGADGGVVIDLPVNPQAAPPVDFAALLTPAQKERLTTTLLNAEELNEGEQLLIRLVGAWKDARLVPFLLKHLARTADKPLYEAEEMMRIVAHTLGDQTLIKFAASYSRTAQYHDLYANNLPDNADEIDPEATAEERAAFKQELAEQKAAAVEALFQRSGKVRHFLALADQPQKP
ncbi:MAG: hypothetical protein QOE47_358 [Pyrinomonadaceae bacterium]|nr:hypothetical protein [Pyrinomonadaceae bacterium]